MRRLILAPLAVAALVVVPTAAHAQEDAGTATTVVVETSTVEQQVPVATTETRDVDTDDDDDSDKTGLWGLLGLLGLAGLAGLKRKRDDTLGPQTGVVPADTRARGATSTDR